MVGAALQRFAIVLMLYAGFAQITSLLGGDLGGVEIAIIYIALLIGIVGLLTELGSELGDS